MTALSFPLVTSASVGTSEFARMRRNVGGGERLRMPAALEVEVRLRALVHGPLLLVESRRRLSHPSPVLSRRVVPSKPNFPPPSNSQPAERMRRMTKASRS